MRLMDQDGDQPSRSGDYAVRFPLGNRSYKATREEQSAMALLNRIRSAERQVLPGYGLVRFAEIHVADRELRMHLDSVRSRSSR